MSETFILPPETRDHAIGRVAKFLSTCLPGQRVKVTVEKYVKRRSHEQNAALWGLAYKILHDETGNETEYLHRYFCGEFFGWVEGEILGQRYKRPRRTTTTDETGKPATLSTVQFAEFFSFIQQRAAESGYYIPDPDPNRQHEVA